MATLNRIIAMLGEQRRDLLEQLDAVDRALEALTRTGGSVLTPPAGSEPRAESAPEPATAPVSEAMLPRRLTPRRMLSDAHRHALTTGRRKAREAKDAANGLAREMPADSFVPAIGSRGDGQAPRLVKRPKR